jgi:hypothetical protein
MSGIHVKLPDILVSDSLMSETPHYVNGVRDDAIAAGLVAPAAFDEGIRDLLRTADSDGVFCYTFFKGVSVIRGPSPPVSQMGRILPTGDR